MGSCNRRYRFFFAGYRPEFRQTECGTDISGYLFCSTQMRILAVITDSQEVRKILRHLVKIGRSPPGLDLASFN